MKKNQKYTQKQMYTAIESWKASELSQARFSKENGFSRDTFKYWLKKYRIEKGIGNTLLPGPFIPVEINSLSSPACLTNQEREITITYPNGIKVTCPSTIGIDQLRELIKL